MLDLPKSGEKLFPPRFFGYTFLGDAKKVSVRSNNTVSSLIRAKWLASGRKINRSSPIWSCTN
jgi:hypothetical protein